MTRRRAPLYWTTAAVVSAASRNNYASYANTIRCPGLCYRAVTRAYALHASASWRRARCAVAQSRVIFACAPRTTWPTVHWDRRRLERQPNDRRFLSGSKTVLQTYSAYIRLTSPTSPPLIITQQTLLEISHHRFCPHFWKINQFILNQIEFSIRFYFIIGIILLYFFLSNLCPNY